MLRDDIDLGRLIKLSNVLDPQGNHAGEHHAIVLTPAAEYAAGKSIKAVVVSSKLHHTSKDRMVMLPHAPGKHPQTKFDRRCAAICDWIVEVQEDDIIDCGNRIYGSLLVNVVKGVRAANTPPPSTRS